KIFVTVSRRRLRTRISGCFYSPCLYIGIPIPFILPALNIHRSGYLSILLNRLFVNLLSPLCDTYFPGVFPGDFQYEIPLPPRAVFTFSALFIQNLNNLSAQFNIHITLNYSSLRDFSDTSFLKKKHLQNPV